MNNKLYVLLSCALVLFASNAAYGMNAQMDRAVLASKVNELKLHENVHFCYNSLGGSYLYRSIASARPTLKAIPKDDGSAELLAYSASKDRYENVVQGEYVRVDSPQDNVYVSKTLSADAQTKAAVKEYINLVYQTWRASPDGRTFPSEWAMYAALYPQWVMGYKLAGAAVVIALVGYAIKKYFAQSQDDESENADTPMNEDIQVGQDAQEYPSGQ